MKHDRENSLTTADLHGMGADDLRALELATRKLGDATQATAARYQRQADRMRKELKRRHEAQRPQGAARRVDAR